LETFRAEDAAVLEAGLHGAYVTVDDTGARHAGKSGYTTQIGADTFTVFRTGPSKSRLAFLSRLCGSTASYVINDAALGYMKDRQLPQAIIDTFADHDERIFSCPEAWEQHLQALGLTGLNVTPDPVQIASEGALWGAIRPQGLLLADTVIVSEDAGQFRIGVHALCWVHYLECSFMWSSCGEADFWRRSRPMPACRTPHNPRRRATVTDAPGGRHCRSRCERYRASRRTLPIRNGVMPAFRAVPCIRRAVAPLLATAALSG